MKCYILASSNSDLSTVNKILDKLNLEYHNCYDFSIGTSFSDLMKRKIRESDFVLALLDEKNQNVLFELGVAEGLNKPIFLLVKKSVKLPFYLEGKMYFQIDWDKESNLLELSLKNYLSDIKKKSTRYQKKNIISPKPNLTIDETNEFLIRVKHLREKSNEIQLVQLIMDVFKKLNLNAVSELKIADKSRVDIAVINKGLSQYFGNPLLFEIKSGKISNNTIDNAEKQLQHYIEKTDANAGVLLYFDNENKRFSYGNKISPFILRFDIEDFIQGIASEGFERLLIKTRNELVHGKIK